MLQRTGARHLSQPGGLWAAVAVLGILLATPAGVRAELTVKGDQAAWAEMTAAYKKLQGLSGYRMKLSTGQAGQEMVMEIVPPASSRTTIPAAGGSMETVTVNGQTRFRMNIPGAPGTWQCQGAPPIQIPRDPTEGAQGTMEVSRGPDTAIEGTPVRTYVTHATFSAQGQNVTSKTTLYVATQTGLPRRAVTSAGGGESTVDFYDYGAKIEITLPLCG